MGGKLSMLRVNKRAILILIGVCLLGIFYFFSKYVRSGVMRDMDFAVTVKVQAKIPGRLDEIMDDGAILVDPIVSSIIVFGLTGWLFLKRKGFRAKLSVFIIPVVFLGLTYLEVYGKHVVPHPGPPFFLIKNPTTIFPKFTIIEPYSYPSGHAARVTFLAVTMIGLWWIKLQKDRQKLILVTSLILCYVLFIYTSRIYLGHHWLSDIIGGGILGLATGIFSCSIISANKQRSQVNP